jgi:hypothetical protein
MAWARMRGREADSSGMAKVPEGKLSQDGKGKAVRFVRFLRIFLVASEFACRN